MGIVGTFILVVFVLSAILLILIVLVQDEQGEGLGGIFGGGSGSAFGPRSGNVLTKITSVLAVIFFLGAFGLAWINRTRETGNIVGKARVETLKENENDWWVKIKEQQSGTSKETNNEATVDKTKAENSDKNVSKESKSD